MADKKILTLNVQPELNMTDLKKTADLVSKNLNMTKALGIDAKSLKPMTQAFTNVTKDFNKTLADGALRFGDNFADRMQKATGNLYKGMAENTANMAGAYGEITKELGNANAKMANTNDKTTKKKITTEFRAFEAKRNKEIAAQSKEFRAKETEFRKQLKRENRRIERKKKAEAELEDIKQNWDDVRTKGIMKSGAGAAREMADGFESALSGISSGDIGGVTDLFQNLGKKMETAGKGYGAEKGGKGTGKIGNMLGGMGKAIAGVAALAAGFAAVVKLIFDADSQAKEFHRTLLAGVGPLDLGVSRADQLGSKLKVAREAAFDFVNNVKWGTLAEEQGAILNAFSQAGFTLKEMTKDAKGLTAQIHSYQEATKTALVYARLLGEDAPETAAKMAEAMEDFGLDLKGVQERFSAIAEAAQISGFGVKRFYSTVLEVTTGMQHYNVRLGEAAGLLLRMTKILGMKAGKDFMTNIANMFKGDSIQERLKKIMLAKPKNVAAIFARSAANTANEFMSKLGKNLSPKQLSKAFKNVGAVLDVPGLEELGDPKKRNAAAMKVMAALKKLSPDQQEKLLARVGRTNSAMATQLENLMDVTKGASTKSITMMAEKLDSLDMGGKMMFAMSQASAMYGKKAIHKLTGTNTAAFAQISGLSMEQIKQLKRVSKRLHGNWKVLQDEKMMMERQYALTKTGTPAERDAAKKQLKALEENQQKNAASMGAMIQKQADGTFKTVAAVKDQSGKFKAAATAPIKGMKDYIQTQGKAIKEAGKAAVPEHIKLAKESIRQTTDVTKYIKMGVQFLMNQLYKMMMAIRDAVSGMNVQEKTTRTSLIKEQETRVASAKKTQDILTTRLAALQLEAKNAKGQRKEQLGQEIKTTKFQLGVVTAGVKSGKAMKEALERSGGKFIGTKTREGFLSEARKDAGGGATEILGKKRYSEWRESAKRGLENSPKAMAQLAERSRGTGKFVGGLRNLGWQKGDVDPAKLKQEKEDEINRRMGVRATRTTGVATDQVVKEIGKQEKAKKAQAVKNNQLMKGGYPKKWGKEYAESYKKVVVTAQAKANVIAERKEKIRDLAQKLGLGKEDAAYAAERYSQFGEITAKFGKKLDAINVGTGKNAPTARQHFFGLGGLVKQAVTGGKVGPANDFLLRLTEAGQLGLVTKFAPGDRLSVSGTQRGGAVEASAAAAGGGAIGAGGGGMRPIVNITINGNEEKAYQVVRKALTTAGVTS